jgi:beta-1,2-mannobiose phosphorylase / 1,2-beta-oligomannan phosphorylase
MPRPRKGYKEGVVKKSVKKQSSLRGGVRGRSPRKAAVIVRALRVAALRTAARRPHQLERHEKNPIVEPREGNFWEMKATFNPGAIYADRRVHLLYRAIGGDDISVLGYASSDDGFTITERLDEPAFVPDTTKKPDPNAPATLPAYCSGGGWNGGCEDPRLTLIGDQVYLMYTAFDGWGSIRIALTSIDVQDFLKKRWSWKKPALISPPGEIHKNWMLFPEKINGKYALLHSISPEISIAYFDSLEGLESGKQTVTSRYDRISRTGSWDSWIRGAGPPPIRTKLGWLLFYHAMDIRDPDRYKLGAMILDANDPAKVLYRSRVPVLEPDMHYENNGFKSGVVYSCGAIVKDGELYVYYGGADVVVCVAMANLDMFLEELAKYGSPQLTIKKKPTRNARR